MMPHFPPAMYLELKSQITALNVSEHQYTGSRFICPDHCGPDADWDVVCLAKELPGLGEPYCGAQDPYFESIKIPLEVGVLNLIVTKDPTFYRQFCSATRVARWLEMTDRDDRVKLFQAILYNANPGVK